MTLTIAATTELGLELAELVQGLCRHGFAATGDRNPRPPDPLDRLRGGAADAALLEGGHSLDLPAELRIAAVLERGAPSDVLVAADGGALSLDTLPPGMGVGVRDLRARGFLLAHRGDLEPSLPAEGPGASEMLRSGSVGAAILGWAEARRGGLAGHVKEVLDPQSWVPAAGQGSLVLVGRAEDEVLRGLGEALDHPSSRASYLAERAALRALPPEVRPAAGVLATPHGRWIRVWGMAASPDGGALVRGDVTGRIEEPEAAGRELAALLLARGIRILFEEARA